MLSKKLLLPLLIILLEAPLIAQKAKDKIIQDLDKNISKYSEIAKDIWEYAEVGYQEEKSTALLQSVLKKEGFTIKQGVAGMPTAFVATYGSGSPTIAILAEFDALPGISQDAVPERKVVKEGAAGHACGHHLFGTGSMAAGIAVKNWLKSSGTSGTIRVYGTPAEEGGAGKVYMVREGLFEDVDAVLHWHPSSRNGAGAKSSLANKSAKFRFYGKASHAAASPEKGRSALDGVEAMNLMVNMLREHVPAEARIHYVITRGGEAPNVVPEFAEVFYYVRHPEMEIVKETFERVVNTAEGAALGTGTKMEYEVIHGLYNVLPNETLSKIMFRNLQKVGGVEYNQEEKLFAEKILATYDPDGLTTESAGLIDPYVYSPRGSGGSTDVGDVSWAVPTAGMNAATWVPGTSAHSWQAVAAGGTTIGFKGMMVAAKTLATTAYDLFKDPSVLAPAKEELLSRRGDNFRYESLLGDRLPPLDYRK
ncbi:amidohydrolase [Fulvivirgaceae bacterium BMA10]|uniref:Amidohydrolase n=1 Tax=Splendidivirga corallicola TaxID=3051826 RepID=A0ABT8KT95_9BACT|nr:amidohydrolase [Fulvivirgaceae bacterium BMA10]